MASPDDGTAALAHATYWNERYSKSDGVQPTHEWFKSYNDLQPFLTKYLFQFRSPDRQPKILHLGAGDSTVPYDLLQGGYKNQICVDFSSVVVDLMNSRASEGIEWLCSDVREMSPVASRSVDIAFDKGTLDAMIYGSPWDPPEEVKQNAYRYMNEVARVLKDDGVFLYVTFRQPHFVRPLLNQEGLWDVIVEVLKESNEMFEYHGFVMTKAAIAQSNQTIT